MPDKVESVGFALTGDIRTQPLQARLAESAPVRIGLIGDLRGRGTRGPVESGRALAGRRWLAIDRDNFEAVLAGLGVELALDLPDGPSSPVVLAFRELDDFHPDRILARAEVFAALRATRHRLLDPATAADAVAELGVSSRAAAPPPPTSPPPEANLPPAALLDLIVQQSTQSERTTPATPTASRAWEEYIDQITAPHICRDVPHQAELIAGVEAAMARILRAILHHPEFQALESLWRAVHLLTRRLETGPELTLELLDLTRAELEEDLVSSSPLEKTAAYKLLVEPSIGIDEGRPWTFLVGDFTFEPSARDAALLWRLGQAARLVGAPFLAAASSQFVAGGALATNTDPDDWGAPEIDEAWSALRRSAEAPYLGLALPRVLLRAPYGPDSATIETFPFEEFPEPPAHESYLWGNPACALALLLGPCFDAVGRFDSERFGDSLTDLPVALERTEEGEARIKPCAEVLLNRRAAERIVRAGLMPLLSVRDQGIVRLDRLVSIAEPAAPLAFR